MRFTTLMQRKKIEGHKESKSHCDFGNSLKFKGMVFFIDFFKQYKGKVLLII